jgi:hypothetical protein
MHADVDYLRLSIDRQPDHWVMTVQNRISGAYLYRARSTSAHCGRCVLLEFVSCELSRRIHEEDVTWLNVEHGPRIEQVASWL